MMSDTRMQRKIDYTNEVIHMMKLLTEARVMQVQHENGKKVDTIRAHAMIDELGACITTMNELNFTARLLHGRKLDKSLAESKAWLDDIEKNNGVQT